MAYRIDQKECIGCGTCMEQCPTKAVTIVKGEYSILADYCIECGACAARCPMKAISGE